MNKRNTLIVTGLGVWVSGLLVGANLVGFIPGEPSWPPGVLLAIGLITSISTLTALFRTPG